MHSDRFDEDAWTVFVKYCKEIDIQRNDTSELLKKMGNDIELVTVIEGILGEVALEWIERKIPALNNGKPVSFVKNKEQAEELKTMLMRMTEWC